MFFGLGNGKKTELPAPGKALAGRSEEMPITNKHFVNGNPIKGPFPEG